MKASLLCYEMMLFKIYENNNISDFCKLNSKYTSSQQSRHFAT